jgi:hypothetical protein
MNLKIINNLSTRLYNMMKRNRSDNNSIQVFIYNNNKNNNKFY